MGATASSNLKTEAAHQSAVDKMPGALNKVLKPRRKRVLDKEGVARVYSSSLSINF